MGQKRPTVGRKPTQRQFSTAKFRALERLKQEHREEFAGYYGEEMLAAGFILAPRRPGETGGAGPLTWQDIEEVSGQLAFPIYAERTTE